MARGSTRTRRDGRFAIALLIALLIALVAGLLPEAAGVVLGAAPTPSASWNFNDGSGSTADDGVGNRNGTLAGGAGWTTTDPFEGAAALHLTNAGGRVTMPNGAALEPATYLGISVWVRHVIDGAGGLVAEKGDAGCDVGTWRLTEWGGNPVFEYRMAGGGVQVASGPTGQFNDGAWHHLAVLLNQANGGATVYVDGRAGQFVSMSGTGLDYDYAGLTTDNLIVGSLGTCADAYATPDADIDDLRIYSVELNPGDIWALEPSYATTTTAAVVPAAPYADEVISFTATTTPIPPITGVTFHYSRDGGPEETISGSSLSNDGHAGWVWYSSLPAGDYVLTAEFAGVGPAEASTSDPVAFTVSRRATDTTLGTPPISPVRPGDSFVLNPSTSWTVPQQGGYPSGPFTLYDVTGPDPVAVTTASGCSVASGNGHCIANLTVPGRDVGTYRFMARFEGSAANMPSDSNEVEVTVSKYAPVLSIDVTPNPVQAHHESTINASVYLPGEANSPSSGTLLVRDTDTDTVLGSVDAPATSLQIVLPGLALGSHHYRAEWSGNDQYIAGSSTATLQVVSDVVEATGIGTNYSVFYPVVDGYRDTVLARGTRQEAASVSFTVRTSGGSIVRKGTVASGTGAYSWAWNGKNTAGTLMPAGTYSITQVLKDAAGTTRTVKTNVTLSRKKLYWYTVDLYRSYSQYQKKASSWAAWLFTMPSATSYRSMRLYLYGRHAVGSAGHYGAQDHRRCSWSTISPGCVGHWGSLPSSLSWVSIALSPTYDRSGRYVRAYAEATLGSIGVSKLRLHLQYGILK